MNITRPGCVAVAAALLSLMSCAARPADALAGNGRVVESERAVAAFTRVESGGSALIRLRKGPVHRVVVTTDQNLQEHFDVRNSGSTLSLSFKPGTSVSRVSKLVVDVYAPSLEAVTLAGSGSAEFMDAFSGDSLGVILSGSGSLSGRVSYEALNLSLSGSGSASLSGSGESLRLSITGSGSFKGRNYAVREASGVLAGSGGAEIAASAALTVTIAGSGSVRYYGSPVLKTTIGGSGSVRQAAP